MIIKATRLQAWAPAGGGGGGNSRPSPPPSKIGNNFWGYIGGLFATFSSYGGLSATFFSFWGPFHHVGAFSLLFTSWWRPFLGLPPPPTKISAGAHDCKEGSRACSPEFFLCERNLVNSGHVCYDFALKMTKIMINCSHVPARWV